MDQHQQSPGYSLKWAWSIVSDFNRKYARATDAVKRIYQFSDENVAQWVANHQDRWQNYKKIVKQLHRWDQTQADLAQEPIDMERSVA
ncbi:unnamed protein product, partial [marine sediment metagenome]